VRSLLLAASFPPALGGIETLLYQTSRRLADPPLVVAPAPARAPDLCVHPVATNLAARLTYRPMWAAHPSLYFLQAFLAPVLRAVNATRPGVIQAGHVYLAPLAWLLARRLRLPFVVYAYGQEVWRAGRPMGLPLLDRRLRGSALRSADRVFVPGNFTAGLLVDWHVQPERMVTLPYGADPRPAISPPGGRNLLSVARLVPRKGIDTVIGAMRRLPPDVQYRIVGGTHRRQKHFGGCHAEGQAEGAVAIIRIEPVVCRPERFASRNEHGLVSRAGDLKEDLVLSLELYLLVVQTT